MILIPAIDLQEGQCVRLEQGDLQKATVFSQDPVAMAEHWIKQGAQRLHLVDLDGACAGKPMNQSIITEIMAAFSEKVSIQVGGGIRNLQAIETYLNKGAAQVIIGSAAIQQTGLVREACLAFPGKIIVSLDAKNGKIAIEGWNCITDFQVTETAKQFEQQGVFALIYTDIERDGMLQGMNVHATLALAQTLSIPVIASGGFSDLSNLEKWVQKGGSQIMGIICGRALYSGAVDFAMAQACLYNLITA